MHRIAEAKCLEWLAVQLLRPSIRHDTSHTLLPSAEFKKQDSVGERMMNHLVSSWFATVFMMAARELRPSVL
jgi:hypothetical protein